MSAQPKRREDAAEPDPFPLMMDCINLLPASEKREILGTGRFMQARSTHRHDPDGPVFREDATRDLGEAFCAEPFPACTE